MAATWIAALPWSLMLFWYFFTASLILNFKISLGVALAKLNTLFTLSLASLSSSAVKLFLYLRYNNFVQLYGVIVVLFELIFNFDIFHHVIRSFLQSLGFWAFESH